MLSSPSLFNAASVVRESKPDSSYIQPTLSHGLRIWWAYYWPTSLAGFVVIYCAAFWLRLLYERAAITAYTFKDLLIALPYLVTAVLGLLAFRYILGKRFRRFHIALLPSASNGNDGSSTLRPIWRRTIRVWWTFTWRFLVYTIVFSIVASVSLGLVTGILSEMGPVMARLVPLFQTVIINAAVGLFVIYSNVLDEEFGDFRVVLLPRETPAESPLTSNAPPQNQATA